MDVMSLFDGGSMGQEALRLAGVPVGFYLASEIDKHAKTVAQANFPDTVQIGDVTQVEADFLPEIDLLMGGSPCQGFSFSGKQLNFEDPRSKLFFEFVRLKKECNPKYWLLENVNMEQEYQDVISEYLGVQPVKLNSVKTSAQNRVRLYWANFEIAEPNDSGKKLQEVVESNEMINKASIVGRRLNSQGKREDYNKSIPITQCLEVRRAKGSNRDKSNCLTTVAKDTVLTNMPLGRYPGAFEMKDKWRNYTKIERCRLMSLPDNYCDSVSLNQAVKITGNGWEVKMLAHIFKGLNNTT